MLNICRNTINFISVNIFSSFYNLRLYYCHHLLSILEEEERTTEKGKTEAKGNGKELKNYRIPLFFSLKKVKLPMLLSKPKKNYKSVSKTDLLSADQSATKQETNNDSFNLSEDVTSINETVKIDYIVKW